MEYTSLSDVPSSVPTNAVESVEKSKQDTDDALDEEIDRALAEIRQDASSNGDITEEESKTSSSSSIEIPLSDGGDDSPTMAPSNADNGMFEADAKTDVTSETSKEVTILDALEYLEKQKKLIQVMFTPSSPPAPAQKMSFLVPASLVVQREREMSAMASANGVAETIWSGSLLGRKCLALVGDIARKATGDDDDYFSCASSDDDGVETCTPTDENTYTFVFGDPSSSGTDLTWNPTLVDAIRSYYTLGSISVSDDCDGRDILFALEYFDIIYSAEQLAHQSFGVHLRVKLWSEYFAVRGQLAEWVTKTIMSGRSKLSYSFVTCSDTNDGPVFVGTKKVEVFDGGIDEEGSNQSAQIVHDLFVDESSLDGEGDRIDSLIRLDFCTYLSNRLPGCSISFDLRYVGIGSPLRGAGADGSNPSTSSIRAVLYLDFSGRKTKKGTNETAAMITLDEAACQTAIQTLNERKEVEDHPNLATAPTVVDLDEEETVDVPIRQVSSDDDCENKSVVSALSSPDDGGSLIATVVEEEQGAGCSIPPPPPPTPKVNALETPGVLTDATEEKNNFVPVTCTQEQPMLPTKTDTSCMTIEDLNSQWLLDFINPFTSFVEETLQACDSNTVANVESVLWPSLLSTANISSGSSSPRSDVCAPPIPLHMTTVDSMDLPPCSLVEERKLPKEAGIEVRPLKTRAADVKTPISNECNAPTPLASNKLHTSPATVTVVENVGNMIGHKQTTSDGTKKMLRSKSTKKVFSKKKSKK